MISEKMSKLLERSAAMSSMYTESARLKEKYGAENVYDFGMGNPNLPAPDIDDPLQNLFNLFVDRTAVSCDNYKFSRL